jgi:small subunit ribosomal protein S3
MGQKTHPYAFRLGVVNDWKSKWYSDNDYVTLVNEDWKLRDYLRGQLRRGAVSRIDIERTRDRVVVEIHTARPGVVIGRKGSEAERLRGALEKMASKPVKLNIIEVKDADTDAQLLSQGIADQLENRVAFRRAMKRAVATAMKAGAEGVRVEAKGRLGGAEMGRREWYREGRVPLHTLRADVDFGMATAHTTVGTIGVKVWVYKGDVIKGAADDREKIAAEAALATGGPATRGRAAPAKARAEQAAGGDRVPRLIEAGGGKRLIEAGGGKREGGRRLIEAGGGKRRIAAEDAEAQYREERKVVDEPGEATEALKDAPAAGSTGDAPAAPEAAAPESTTPAAEAAGAEAPAAEAPVAEAPASEVTEEAPVEETAEVTGETSEQETAGVSESTTGAADAVAESAEGTADDSSDDSSADSSDDSADESADEEEE